MKLDVSLTLVSMWNQTCDTACLNSPRGPVCSGLDSSRIARMWPKWVELLWIMRSCGGGRVIMRMRLLKTVFSGVSQSQIAFQAFLDSEFQESVSRWWGFHPVQCHSPQFNPIVHHMSGLSSAPIALSPQFPQSVTSQLVCHSKKGCPEEGAGVCFYLQLRLYTGLEPCHISGLEERTALWV